MTSRVLAVASSPSSTSGVQSFGLAPLFVAFVALSALLVIGGILAGKNIQRKKRRNLFKFFGSWWKRRQQGYIRQDDTAEESVVTEVHSYYPPPTFSSSLEEAVEEVEEPSVATKSMYYENTPMLPPRPDDDSLVSEITYIPPPDTVIPPSSVSKARQYTYRWNEVSSFQSSLESLDSLVESYWDPSDDQSQLSLVPIEMNPSAVIEEHMAFLQRQVKAAAREELRAKEKSLEIQWIE